MPQHIPIGLSLPSRSSRETIPILQCEHSFGDTLAETCFDFLTYGTFDTVFCKTRFS